MRKLLELSDDSTSVITDGRAAYGLGPSVRAPNVLEIAVRSHATWEVIVDGTSYVKVAYGRASLPRPLVDFSKFADTGRERSGGSTPTASGGSSRRRRSRGTEPRSWCPATPLVRRRGSAPTPYPSSRRRWTPPTSSASGEWTARSSSAPTGVATRSASSSTGRRPCTGTPRASRAVQLGGPVPDHDGAAVTPRRHLRRRDRGPDPPTPATSQASGGRGGGRGVLRQQ